MQKIKLQIRCAWIFSAMVLLIACAAEFEHEAPPTGLLEHSAYRSLQQGLQSFSAGNFVASRAAFDRVLELASPGDSQLVFLGVYYGIRSRLMIGQPVSADSVYDHWRLSLPRGQVTEIELVLGRISPQLTEAKLAQMEATANTLGVILPLSGKFSEFGNAILEGIELAVQEYNANFPEENHAKLRVVDDRSDQMRAASLGRELASEKSIFALIGSHGNETSMAISLVASAERVPLVCPTASAPGMDDLGPMVHIINRTDPDLAVTLAEYAVEKLGYQTFAVLAPDDDYGNLLADTFDRALKARGAAVVSSLRYGGEIKNFENQMNLLRRYLPDAIYLPAHSNEITQIAAQVFYYGLNQVRILGTELWNNERVIRMGGEYVNGVVFVAPFYEKSSSLRWNEFKDLYESAYRRPVNRFSALGFDSADLVLNAAAKFPTSRRVLAERLNSIESHPGAMGVYTIKSTGKVKRDVFILQILNGSIVPAGSSDAQVDSLSRSIPSDSPADNQTPRQTP
jgi:branched-chain amino acid transport system substrate-binding protein